MKRDKRDVGSEGGEVGVQVHGMDVDGRGQKLLNKVPRRCIGWLRPKVSPLAWKQVCRGKT